MTENPQIYLPNHQILSGYQMIILHVDTSLGLVC